MYLIMSGPFKYYIPKLEEMQRSNVVKLWKYDLNVYMASAAAKCTISCPIKLASSLPGLIAIFSISQVNIFRLVCYILLVKEEKKKNCKMFLHLLRQTKETA